MINHLNSRTLRTLAAGLVSTQVHAEPQRKKRAYFFAGSSSAIPGASGKSWSVLTPVELDQSEYRKVTFGKNFACGLTEKGEVTKWVGNEKKKFPTEDVVDIDCTRDRVFALTKRGEVLVEGEDGNLGKLQFPKRTMWYFWSREARITQISVNARHALFKTSEGDVFTAGDNRWGQCGRKLPERKFALDGTEISPDENEYLDWVDKILGDSEIASDEVCKVSQLEAIPEKAKAVMAGERHSLVLTESGKMFAFGDDSKLQLNFGDTRASDDEFAPWLSGLVYKGSSGNTPKKFPVSYNFYQRHCRWRPTEALPPAYGNFKFDKECLSVVAGREHSAFVYLDPQPEISSENTVQFGHVMFACGQNSQGQCGRNTSTHQQIALPVRLPRGAKILSVCAGNDHTVALVRESHVDKIFAFGGNRQGQCAVGNLAHAVCPPAVIWNSKIRAPRKFSIQNTSDERLSLDEMRRHRVLAAHAKYDNTVVIVESDLSS